MNKLDRTDWRTIRYTVKTEGDKATVTAHLPAGFTMRQYSRIYHLHDAEDFGMTKTEWIEHQQKELFKDLMVRIAQTPDNRLLN